ncbi:MAG: bifunctional aspartokinase / homoserine dehydrogenase 1 [Blastocatellia bacterium]|nr:bifunctional aspartokinase / homoserine dehydrogenase 1 [Blastocatellia bacterium]
MRDKLQVMKFGGTSVGDADCVRRAAEIVARASGEGAVLVVVSAMSGVTNQLILAAQQSVNGDETESREIAAALLNQHSVAVYALIKDEARRSQLTSEVEQIIGEVKSLCRGITLLRELTPRTLAVVSSIGERLSARLMAGALNERGVPSQAIEATDLIITDDDYGQAEPLMEQTRERATERLRPLLNEGITPVVTGFIGATAEGALTTLGRGGSDYSATVLGAALDADEIIIWTDVDGVLTTDPRLVPEARLLREISYNEAAELAFFGAKVLHPKTLRPVAEAGIPVWIRNSFAPENPGTRITQRGRPTNNGVRGITAISNVSLITVGGRGIVGVIGVAAKTFHAVASVRANVLLISQSSSENDICLIVDSVDAARTLKALREAFASDLIHHDVEHITVNSEIAIVAVVGDRMRGTPGIAGRTFSALGRRGINIIAIAQGSSEYNVSFVVEANATREAVGAVHDEFNLHLRSSRFESEESVRGPVWVPQIV